MTFDDYLQQKLQVRRNKKLFRQRALVQGTACVEQQVDEQRLVNFCSNDYLGLAGHPSVRKAMADVALSEGVGSGASHLVSGHSLYHHALEDKLAEITGRERALLFSTGYMANLGLITALAGKTQHVIADKLNHASLVDACQLASAQQGRKLFFRYRHGDLEHCERLLQQAPEHSLIVTDGVFSMDGDVAPLSALSALANEYRAVLIVDDAHGFGCLGSNGEGSVSCFGLAASNVPVYMGTLGKAVGGFGAFVAGSEYLIETLIQFSRPYIYTTAMPPAMAAANLASLQVIEQSPELRARLLQRIAEFKVAILPLLRSFPQCQLLPSDTAIQPLIIGNEQAVIDISLQLKKAGFWAGAIRPPTVPKGTARLRITLSAAHSRNQIESFIQALQEALSKVLGSIRD